MKLFSNLLSVLGAVGSTVLLALSLVVLEGFIVVLNVAHLIMQNIIETVQYFQYCKEHK